MSMSRAQKQAQEDTRSSQPQTSSKLDSQVEGREERRENRGTREIKAENRSISLSQEGVQKEIRDQLKANYEAWKEDSDNTTARDQFNSQATSLGQAAGLRGTRPRLSENGDSVEFDE